MPITLYYYPGASSLATHALLIEAKLPYTIEFIDLASPARKTPSGVDYSKINPRGSVPAVKLEDGTIITQNNAIFLYLGKLSKLPGMNPEAGSLEQARLVEALSFLSDLRGSFAPLFLPTTPEDARKIADAQVDQRLKQLDEWIEQNNKEYWLSNELTQADIYAAVCLSWAERIKKDVSSFKHVAALKNKVFARPAVLQALKEENLI